MISTSRGLSAVRPGDDPDAGAAGFWQGGPRRPVTVGPEAALADGGAAGRRPARCRRASAARRRGGATADGSDSTATTSALAV